MEEERKRDANLADWIENNKKKIQQFFEYREPEYDELIENIDAIEDFEVKVE